MAENETMEGKDLAIKEKKEFEERVLEATQNLKEGQTTISTEGLEVTNSKDNYIIKLNGIPFGLVSKDGEFTYSRENFKQVKKALEEEGITLEDLGLPDVEEWIDQEEKQKKDQGIDEYEKDEKDLSDKKKEQQKDKEEQEKDKDEGEEQQVNNGRKRNLIRLNDKIFKVLIPSTQNYSGIYLDTDTGEIVGKDKAHPKDEPVPIKGLSLIKGVNSSKPIHGMDNGEHKHVNAYRMYQIDNRPNTGFAVLRDGTEKGNFDVKYTTRRKDSNDIRDFAYVDIPLLASQTRMGSGRALEVSGVRAGRTGQGEQDKIQDELDELNEKIEVPEDITESFNTEMQKLPNGITSMKEFKEILYEIVKEQLDEERPNDFPDSHKSHAKQIVDAMVDENKGYKQAKDELYNGQTKDDDREGKEMGEDPRKREH